MIICLRRQDEKERKFCWNMMPMGLASHVKNVGSMDLTRCGWHSKSDVCLSWR